MIALLLSSTLAIAAPLQDGQAFTLYTGFQHQRQTAGLYEAWEAPVTLEYALQGRQHPLSDAPERLGLRVAASNAVGPRAYVAPWDAAWGQRWRGLLVVRGVFQGRFVGAELGLGYYSSRVTEGLVPSAELWLGNPRGLHGWWRFFPGTTFGDVARSGASAGLTHAGDNHQVQLGLQSSAGQVNPSVMASARVRVPESGGPWDVWLGGFARLDLNTILGDVPRQDAALGVQVHLHRRPSTAPEDGI